MLELNPELQALLIAGVTFLVTEGLKALSEMLGWDLSGLGAAITAALVAVALTAVNGLLGLIPPQYYEIARSVMALLVVIFGSFGIHRQFKRYDPQRALG